MLKTIEIWGAFVWITSLECKCSMFPMLQKLQDEYLLASLL
jgi:hypothetical protein